jgi:hypothetical protein
LSVTALVSSFEANIDGLTDWIDLYISIEAGVVECVSVGNSVSLFYID